MGTVHNILKINGLDCPQKRMRGIKPIAPIFDPKCCKDVWNTDYKRTFLMNNKTHCNPLTITASKTNFLRQKDIIEKTKSLPKFISRSFSEHTASLNKSRQTMGIVFVRLA